MFPFALHRKNTAMQRTSSPRSRLLSAITAILLCAGYSAAQTNTPAWWTSRGVIDTNSAPNDYAALNVGQLKHLAYMAWLELDALPPGAGFEPAFTNAGLNYAAVNIGQLKEAARPFYDRLGCNYPWSGFVASNDFAIANIGQAKNLFKFMLAPLPVLDTDGDGLSDEWEIQNGTNPNAADTDGDGLPDGWEVLHGFDPTDGTDGSQDSDGDGLPDGGEFLLGTSMLGLGVIDSSDLLQLRLRTPVQK